MSDHTEFQLSHLDEVREILWKIQKLESLEEIHDLAKQALLSLQAEP